MNKKYIVGVVIIITTILGISCLYYGFELHRQASQVDEEIQLQRKSMGLAVVVYKEDFTYDLKSKNVWEILLKNGWISETTRKDMAILEASAEQRSKGLPGVTSDESKRIVEILQRPFKEISPDGTMPVTVLNKTFFNRYDILLSPPETEKERAICNQNFISRFISKNYINVFTWDWRERRNKASILKETGKLLMISGVILILFPPILLFLLVPALYKTFKGIKNLYKKNITKENIEKTKDSGKEYWKKFEKLILKITFGQRIVIGVVVSIITCIICYLITYDYVDLFDISEAFLAWILITIVLGLVWFELLKFPRKENDS